MDPTATLARLLELLATDDKTRTHELEEAALALADWIGRGGFWPNVGAAIEARAARAVAAYDDLMRADA